MHWADRYCLIHKAGWTPTTIARALGVTPTGVSQVLRDQAISYNIASFIAAQTGVPLSRLWPDGRYNTPSRRPPWKATKRKNSNPRPGGDLPARRRSAA